MKQRRRRGFLASDEGLEKLEERMLQKGYTQESLAVVAGVSLDQVKKLFHPNWGRSIQKDAIRKIARTLELNPTDIVDSSEWYPQRKTTNADQEALDTTDTSKQHSKTENFQVEEAASDRANSHFSSNFHVSDPDLQAVFGKEDDPYRRNFVIGKHIDTDEPICLDLDRIVARSTGVFGKPATGESLFSKVLVSGIIYKQAAVNLIFDLHSEYGWEAFRRGKGLGQLFPGQVQIYTLDPDSTKRRGVQNAQDLYLTYDQIELEDIMLLRQELNLSEVSLENALILRQEFGRAWITQLLSMSNQKIQEFCDEKQGSKSSIMALQRKLMRLDELKYMRMACSHNYVHQILESLEAGKHVVIEFGSQSSMLSYMLATHVIARQIHASYVRKTEKFLQTKNPTSDRPKVLTIAIEEAYQFLNSKVVPQTVFSTIIRELSKSFITLLVVDRHPSKVDREVLSDLGTRITGWLNDEDIDAIFSGVSGTQSLRSMLSKLDSTQHQQALIFGHAVPMPVVVQTRPYDQTYYAEIANLAWWE